MHYFMGELRCHAIQEAFELRSDESHASPASEDARISPTSMLLNLKRKTFLHQLAWLQHCDPMITSKLLFPLPSARDNARIREIHFEQQPGQGSAHWTLMWYELLQPKHTFPVRLDMIQSQHVVSTPSLQWTMKRTHLNDSSDSGTCIAYYTCLLTSLPVSLVQVTCKSDCPRASRTVRGALAFSLGSFR